MTKNYLLAIFFGFAILLSGCLGGGGSDSPSSGSSQDATSEIQGLKTPSLVTIVDAQAD
ncbi:hypothetical protein [Thiomicrospira cyclica]|uniref:Uncharacterized protein n=1 Tax=Thiomicrospira cyclica (strain DSM 14477 / JCM 11371 / ALM1) TaxID=717773 RepID=F6DD26_THICA|nr:hypothetical protein [Thiomicrospira cyclica]AEG31762.1 hypothetical protein Thicy_0995 [Thiomicrospira cyclica ALM1]